MQKHRIGFSSLVLLTALSLVHPAAAQEVRAPAAAARHSLWKVEGRSNAVYLLGSIHLLKPENYPLAAPIEAAFTNSRIAVFETDVGEMEQMGTQLKLLSKVTLPEGQTLRDQLSAGTYAMFSNHISAAGLPAVMFDQFKPFMAAMTLEVLELQKLGVDPEHGLDKHFFDRARKDGKQIVPLETVDFQLDLITGFSKEDGESVMKATLKDLDNETKEFGVMVTAWQTGDTARLEKFLNEAMQDAPAIYKRLVTDRSQSWAPKIEELSRGGTNAIVIVGAGHLVGKDGVVELLKKKGLKVTQQ
jgi:uncharacterized protein